RVRVLVARRQVAPAGVARSRRSDVRVRAGRARGQALLEPSRRRSARDRPRRREQRRARAARVGRLDAVDAARAAARAAAADVARSKREILEDYLTRTPYGDNVEGIESAAYAYFGHSAQHLTPLEIATLLAVPQGPQRFSPAPGNTARLGARRDAILAKLVDA